MTMIYVTQYNHFRIDFYQCMFACVFLNRFNGYWYCSVGRNVVEMVTYTFAFWIFEYLIAKMRSWMPRRAWALNLIYAATFCIGPSSIYSHFIYSVFAFGAAVVSLCSIELLLMHLINCLCQERERRSLVTCFGIKSEWTFIANGLRFGRSCFKCLNSHDSWVILTCSSDQFSFVKSMKMSSNVRSKIADGKFHHIQR